MMNKNNANIKSLLVGLVLGDAHINKIGNKSFITMEQSVKHNDYMLHLHSELNAGGIPLHPMKYYSRLDKRYNVTNESVYFKSHNLETLNFLSDMFMVNSNKTIPLDINKWITPISLAHWICGDGQLVKGGGITLCTDSYSKIEINVLVECLREKFDANCSIHKKKGKNGNIYHRIYINKVSFDNIKPLIVAHMHESFLYKLHL